VVTVLGRKKEVRVEIGCGERRNVVLGSGRKFRDKVGPQAGRSSSFSFSGPIEPSDGAKSSPEFCRERNCCGGKQISPD
jgi:hypothetical protein